MDKTTIDDLKQALEGSGKFLQELPERKTVDSDVDILFDSLAKSHHDLISNIIDYLEQNQ